MRAYWITLAFFYGALIASFVELAAWRIPRGMSVNAPRSFCPECGKTLLWRDVIPVYSYIMLLGKCRFCRAKIPARHLLAEVAGGLFFAGLVYLLF
jgi:leader peptidase (prepilin peptidase)/N-methyltransferase